MVIAPHIMVEDVTLQSIERARLAYEQSDLRSKLARHHADVDSAFWGWNNMWLAPQFRSWSIEKDIRTISCPVLAIQGIDDEYGTLAQIRDIQRHVPQTQLLELGNCGHWPQRDQPQALSRACAGFYRAQV